ncbi:hypothetical protein BVG79_01096 [Ketogulonicigenium robustum]|uniref:Uncharacterized protein n=1 Tax=Ketogulonicigenium robustum TaxID=92947 RepID=A0A1W6NYX0_9RHOB|nr:hypothetical protein BVG79_01096 [Ketogulonicigenium robustum]
MGVAYEAILLTVRLDFGEISAQSRLNFSCSSAYFECRFGKIQFYFTLVCTFYLQETYSMICITT